MESLLDVPQHRQPCLSDPAVLEKCVKNVRQLLRAYPDARVISVSQNDCHPYEETWCTCPECSRIDEEEESHAGTMLRFVNAVADAIKDEFPKVKIMTLAYLHTIKCPKITRPRPNTLYPIPRFLARLDEMEACWQQAEAAAATLAENARFYEQLKKYHVRPRGSMSALPELTDTTKNMATEIYWSDIALSMLSPDQL